ncbi:MAG: multiheme c-type cytochrome [Haliangium ochraceum]
MGPRKRARRATRARSAALAAATVLAAFSAHGAAPGAATGERRMTLFYTAEVHGTVEPCGCTSDPLGDVSRLAAVVADARRADTRQADPGVALVDAGGLLYPDEAIAAKERPAAELRAAFLAAQFERLGLLGATLDEADTRGGPDRVRPARLASNFTGARGLAPPRIEKVGGISLGVLGIADPSAATALGARARDMVEAARADVGNLRRGGAEVVVLLAAVDKNAARKLARDSGADVVVLGKRVGAGLERLEKVGRALIVAPADELQRVGRLEIVLRERVDPGTAGAAAIGLEDGGGPEAMRLRRAEVDRAIERLRVGLASWAGGASGTRAAAEPGTDGAFVAAKKRELADLQSERARLDAPWTPPARGNYVVNSLVPLRRSLRRDAVVVAAMKKLDQRIAAVNLRQAVAPPVAEAGRAFYVGMNRCTGCHKAATVFWNKTVHAHAWKTLVDGGKQADYKCIGCHVTGFGQVGGSSLGFTKKLESVQCETCHGPGSAHVAGEGNEEPLAIKRDTPETVCLSCHTEQHSDTFRFDAYLRDVVGAGHAPERRAALGAGPTGHELRSAALAKAKAAGAAQTATAGKAGVKKM